MNIELFLFAKKPSSPEIDWINIYLKRIKVFCKISCFYFKPSQSGKFVQGFKPQAKSSQLFILDEQGATCSSIEFSELLFQKDRAKHNNLVFVVGGSYGIPSEIYDLPHHKISLSSFTLPHKLAYLVLAEQLYRSFTIFHRSPYHHA